MRKSRDGQPCGQYTTESKLDAVRLVTGRQSASVAAKVLGIPKQMWQNCVNRSAKGVLVAAGGKPVSKEKMRLALVKMARDIRKRARNTP